MSETQICPWCQTEIVWDEETGPEDLCPHCLNVLNDYRTVTVQLDAEDSEGAEADGLSTGHLTYGEISRAFDVLLPGQTEDLDCEQCQDRMVEAGKVRLDSDRFHPLVRPGLPQLLKVPVELAVLVCPSCYQVKTVLAGDSRKQFMHAIREMGKVK